MSRDPFAPHLAINASSISTHDSLYETFPLLRGPFIVTKMASSASGYFDPIVIARVAFRKRPLTSVLYILHEYSAAYRMYKIHGAFPTILSLSNQVVICTCLPCRFLYCIMTIFRLNFNLIFVILKNDKMPEKTPVSFSTRFHLNFLFLIRLQP